MFYLRLSEINQGKYLSPKFHKKPGGGKSLKISSESVFAAKSASAIEGPFPEGLERPCGGKKWSPKAACEDDAFHGRDGVLRTGREGSRSPDDSEERRTRCGRPARIG